MIQKSGDLLYNGKINKNGDKRGCFETHGMSKTRLYNCWTDMKKRCYNINNKRYANYGGRGIVVCEDWKNSFEKFFYWAIENGYNDALTLDRIDVNKNYEPDNCRWVTTKQQQRNTTRNHYVTAFGKTQTIAEWSEQTGLSQDLIKDRLNKLNWSAEDAVSIPVLKSRYDKRRKNNANT